MHSRGFLCTVLGIDGSGKSTLARRLKEHYGDDALVVHGNGGTALNEALMAAYFAHADAKTFDGFSMFNLINAVRWSLWNQKIVPALEAGRLVIVERWHGCSKAYNEHAQESAEVADHFDRIIETFHQTHSIDLELFLDTPVDLAMSRQQKGGKAEGTALNHFDRERRAFRVAVRRGYLAYLNDVTHACYTLNGNDAPQQLLDLAVEHIERVRAGW